MYATAKHKLPADSSGSSVALWPAVLAQKTVFLLPLNCVVENTVGESPAQLLHVSSEQILSVLSFFLPWQTETQWGRSIFSDGVSVCCWLTLSNWPVP